MVNDFGRLIERMVERYGLWKVVTTPFAVVPVLVALGLVVGKRPAAILALLASFLILFVVIAALGAQLRMSRVAHAGLDRTIVRLTETVLAESMTAAYTWEKWRERTTIAKHGDTVIEQWRTLQVNPGSTLRVVWAGQTMTVGQLSDRERRRIKVSAYDFSDKGGRSEIGIEYDLVTVWQPKDQALVVYLCLDRPLDAGDRMNVLLIWTWPGYYAQLVAGGRDEMFIERKRAAAKRIDLTVKFDKSCEMASTLRLQPLKGCPEPVRKVDPDGTVTVSATFGPANVPERVGFILDNRHQ